MVKVNNKDTRTTLFHTLLQCFIFNFEQVNAGWEDVNGFKSTGRVTSFTCFDREKGLRNRGKSQDYFVSCPTENLYIHLDFKHKSYNFKPIIYCSFDEDFKSGMYFSLKLMSHGI